MEIVRWVFIVSCAVACLIYISYAPMHWYRSRFGLVIVLNILFAGLRETTPNDTIMYQAFTVASILLNIWFILTIIKVQERSYRERNSKPKD